MESENEPGAHDLTQLRCLHELARQLLPLGTPRDVARDGLLCVAGITGVGSGVVLWRRQERGPFELLSHFGLGPGRTRNAYTLSKKAQRALGGGVPVALGSLPRRPGGRGLQSALEPLISRLGDGWIVVLEGETAPRGLLLLGPSLVTGELVQPVPGLVDLGEVLRLGLLGQDGSSSTGATPKRPTGRVRGGVAKRLAALRRAYPQTTAFVGSSASTLELLEEIVSLAGTEYTVLVRGETGTGKELAARLLHDSSRRATGPFEAVDCSSIPRELIESELFGHVKGAFTGATRDFRGAFERAEGGTLLLDEIGDMDLRSQTRLLRVLQEGSVRRLGGDHPTPVNVRVVAATHQDLARLVRENRFREDLYYRIHVCLVHIPPLRARGDDSVLLFESFMRDAARELGRTPRTLVPSTRERLRGAGFPGNVRQLQNVVRQLLVQSEHRGPVEPDELDKVLDRSAVPSRVEPAPPNAPDPPRRVVDESVAEIGPWVVQQLRGDRFNLRATQRRLQELRHAGANRQAIPVFDRGALDYYLCGEFLHLLVEKKFQVEPVVLELAGHRSLVPRLRRKVRAYLQPLTGLASVEDRKDARSEWIRKHYGRLPERYVMDLERTVQALGDGRLRFET